MKEKYKGIVIMIGSFIILLMLLAIDYSIIKKQIAKGERLQKELLAKDSLLAEATINNIELRKELDICKTIKADTMLRIINGSTEVWLKYNWPDGTHEVKLYRSQQ